MSYPHLLDWHLLDDATWQAQVERAVYHYQHPSWPRTAQDRSLGLLFFNPSLRTRTSMEVAAAHLGAHVSTLIPGQGTWNFAWQEGKVMLGHEAEHIREAIGVLSRYYDALGVRVFAGQRVYTQDRDDVLLHTIADTATVPVISLESAFYHPCQALADAATWVTHFDGALRGKKLVLSWTYHPKALPMAVPNSALLAATRMGMDVTVARPEGFDLDPGVMARAQDYANAHQATLETTTDLDAACDGADVVYAKAWGGTSLYTDTEEEAQRRAACMDWRITEDRMQRTNEGIFMHCLPVRRNVVVEDAVLDGPQARHLLQAEFRLHAQKAILERTWGLL